VKGLGDDGWAGRSPGELLLSAAGDGQGPPPQLPPANEVANGGGGEPVAGSFASVETGAESPGRSGDRNAAHTLARGPDRLLRDRQHVEGILNPCGPDAQNVPRSPTSSTAHRRTARTPPRESTYLEYKASFCTRTQGDQAGECSRRSRPPRSRPSRRCSTPAQAAPCSSASTTTVVAQDLAPTTPRFTGLTATTPTCSCFTSTRPSPTQSGRTGCSRRCRYRDPPVDGRDDLCHVHVRPSKFPVEATVVKNGQHENVAHLYGGSQPDPPHHGRG
jgi:hypothetical protein